MKLRCLVKKSSGGYVGVCLELSLAVKADTPGKCREELSQIVKEYVETLRILKEQHKKVGIRSVEFYLIRKVLFDIMLLFGKGNRLYFVQNGIFI